MGNIYAAAWYIVHLREVNWIAVLVSDARKVQFVLSVCELWLLVASESVCILNSLNPLFGSWADIKYKRFQ